MRRHDIVIESSGNLQVNRKQNTYSLESKRISVNFIFFSSKQSFLVVKKEKAANWLKIHKEKDSRFFANSQGSILFYCFLFHCKNSIIAYIFLAFLNSQRNTTCFVSMVIYKFMEET